MEAERRVGRAAPGMCHGGWIGGCIGLLAAALTVGCSGKVTCDRHEECLASEYCSPTGVCAPNPCFGAGQGFLRCDGDVLVTCDASLLPVRADCAPHACNADAQRCEVCDPSPEQYCHDADLVRCTEDGTWVVQETCEAGCDAADPVTGVEAHCRDCTPNALLCVGDRLVSCNAAGEVAQTEDCPHGCSEERGACNDCDPGAVTCRGEDLVTCDAAGRIQDEQNCAYGCGATPGTCNECTPGATECHGQDLVTCDGEGRIQAQQNCAYGCGATPGTCNECTPGATECHGDELVTCDGEGRIQAQQSCAYGCGATPGTCNECTPGATECHGDELVICDGAGRIASQQGCGRLGCSENGGAHCRTFTPTVVQFDHILTATSSLTVLVNETLVVDTTAKTLRIGTNLLSGYSHHTYTTNGREIWAVHFDSVTIGGVVEVSGQRGFAITSSSGMMVTGRIDASAHGTTPGPGGASSFDSDPAEGGGVACAEFCGPGAGGGGHSGSGGSGGGSNAGLGAAGASPIPDATFSPIWGGGAGGQCTLQVRPGGGGGGIVILIALDELSTFDQVGPMSFVGIVDVSGGGGAPNTGGGAGGTVIVEAPLVSGIGILRARGGGGGSDQSGEDGRDGGRGDTSPEGDGGDGGWSVGREGYLDGEDGSFGNCNGGGGGGAAGRILVRVMDSVGTGSVTLDLAPDVVSGGAVVTTFTPQ